MFYTIIRQVFVPARNLIIRLSPLLMVIFLILWMRSCREGVETGNRYARNLNAKEDSLRRYRLANGQLVYEKSLLQVSSQELRQQIWMKDDSLSRLLKKLQQPLVGVKSEVRYVYDSVEIPFIKPVNESFQGSFRKEEEWFSISGSVNQKGLLIDRISIPNTQRLVVGYKKGMPVVSVTNSNPYLIMDSIEGQLLHIPKRRWVLGAGGFWNIYEPPSLGFFLGYKLLEF